MFPPHVRPVELKIQSTVAKSTNAEFQVSCQAPQAGERKSAHYVCDLNDSGNERSGAEGLCISNLGGTLAAG